MEAVFDPDPQRVCTLQGHVAVKGSVVKDEPIKELLRNINKTLTQHLERKYNGDESTIPSVDHLSGRPQCHGDERYPAPETSAWLEALAGPTLGWLRAPVVSSIIVQGTSYIDNPSRRSLAPRSGQKVIVSRTGTVPSSVTPYGAARSHGECKPEFKALEIKFNSVIIFEDRRDTPAPLSALLVQARLRLCTHPRNRRGTH